MHAVPPTNDSFDSRASLGSVATFSISGDNAEATLEAGEVTYGGIAGSSVWYEWTAPSSGWVNIISTITTDTVLGVFTGNSVGELTQLGFNDDAAQAGTGEHWSLLSFFAIAGTSYKISVAGYDDGSSVATDDSVDDAREDVTVGAEAGEAAPEDICGAILRVLPSLDVSATRVDVIRALRTANQAKLTSLAEMFRVLNGDSADVYEDSIAKAILEVFDRWGRRGFRNSTLRIT
jgi:hypothetical protein